MRFSTTITTLTLALGFVLLGTIPCSAAAKPKQPNKKAVAESSTEDTEKSDKEEDEEEKPPKTVEEVLENCEKIEGLFELHQNSETGESWLLLNEEQIDSEFIYFSHYVDGLPLAGQSRGIFNDSYVFTIERHFDHIQFVRQNTSFYFDPKNAISKAAEANIGRAVLASIKIEAETDEQVALKLNELFLNEVFLQVSPSPPSDPDPEAAEHDTFSMGKLSSDKTQFHSLKSYPENTAITVDYAFENPTPKDAYKLGDDITDPRNISVRVQHSLLALPDSDYTPRFDDPRVGYFMTRVTDQTATDATPYRDLIHRWRLVKKNPKAKLSEPENPITWWIENTTPKEYRDTIKTAALKWNLAFESAGFKNAVEVRIQPDDADWEAGDIRYNVLRWTSSPDPPFGGYGPSFVNPRTGEIIGSDIMLEYSFLTNRLFYDRIYPSDNATAVSNGRCACSNALCMQESQILGRNHLKVMKAPKADQTRLVEEGLTALILHEIGHTLGLNHNFKSSTLNTPAQMHNRGRTGKLGVSASVMDYNPINLHPDPAKQGHFYNFVPGVYDHWAIAFGYSPSLEDEDAEKTRMTEILSRSTDPKLAFGNDADDMRSPGKGIDPRVMIYDMSSDPIAYAAERYALSKDLLAKLPDNFPQDGTSYQELRNAHSILQRDQRTALMIASRWIGGVFVDRAFAGQEGAKQPFTPVPLDKQKAAMALLAEHGFSANALTTPPEVAALLQTQRRGFEFFKKENGEDPKLHQRVLRAQAEALAHLLHPNVQNRILNTMAYGNEYPLSEVMSDLSAAIFPEDNKAAPTTFQQGLQLHYTNSLLAIVDHIDYLAAARSTALHEVRKIEAMHVPLAETRADAGYLLHRIREALKEKN